MGTLFSYRHADGRMDETQMMRWLLTIDSSVVIMILIIIYCREQYFEHIEEMEWAIEVCKERSVPVAATMCIGPEGDLHGFSAGECAVRMARAGLYLNFLSTVHKSIINSYKHEI